MTAWLDRWLSAPEPRLAERLGLFRIVYALFYLWYLAWVDSRMFASLPDELWEPVGVFTLAGLRPSVAVVGAAESLLAAALVLLAFGLWARAATLAVLVLGVYVEGFQQCFGKVEHGSVFLSLYIPLFMLSGAWGECWSVDRSRGLRGAGGVASAWPVHALELMLAALFFSAAAAKIILGDWLSGTVVVENLLLGKNVDLTSHGLPAASVLVAVAENPTLAHAARIGVPVFELAAVLLLLGPRLRNLYASVALIFHGLNALVLGVTFTPIAVVYGAFVDWPRLADVTGLSRLPLLPRRLGVTVAVVSAVLVGLGWNGADWLRGVLRVGGTLDWRSVWYGLLPAALAWFAASLRARSHRSLPAGGRDC